MEKVSFNITGMTCSACSARIEKRLLKSNGIIEVNVNLLTNSMTAAFDPELINVSQIIKKVGEIGYGASLKTTAFKTKTENISKTMQPESSSIKQRLIFSLIFTIPLFYISMGEMLSWPLPEFITGMENAMIYAFTLFLLALPVVIAGCTFFFNGFKNLIRLSPNMDSLIAIGSGAAFLYGIFAVYRIAWGFGHDDMSVVHKFSMDLYFESAAMILTLITLGKYFEARAKSRTSEAIIKLMNLTPKTAVLIRDGNECEVSVEDVETGDILVVKDGSSVPVDGIVAEGYASVDESAITGESLPVEKRINDKVIGGTVIKSGYFKMEAKSVRENTVLANIIRLVDEATSSKAPIAKLADKISGIFVPIVIIIAVCAVVIWLLFEYDFEFSLTAGISVLVISCPCALGLATPTAIMAGTGKGASGGILIKSAAALENLHNINVVVLDKTGTITEGKPVVTDIIPFGISETELLVLAASLEKMSGHPLAAPIIERAEKNKTVFMNARDYKLIPGQGIVGYINDLQICGGNKKMMIEYGIDVTGYKIEEKKLANEGKTVLYFSQGTNFIGIIAVADTIKPESKEAVAELIKMGLDVFMLTGDNKETAEAIKKQTGIKKAVAEALPEDKEREIRVLQSSGKKVAMVGDGINDAPSLARADVGIAIGAGTDIAIESADIVLMKSDLRDVITAIRLSKAVMRNIRQNLFWAFIYNIIGIPVAAGVFYAAFGWLLNPMIAAAAMSFSSVSVVTNALRLNFFKLKNDNKNNKGKALFMKKTLKIEGMSCMHCVGAVKKALMSVEGVSDAEVDLEKKSATVITVCKVTDESIRTAVEEMGFHVTDIK